MEFENRYSFAQRLLHRLAFSSGGLQVALADIEDRLYGGQFRDIQVDDPVFVTALPRAGTTILLDMLVESGLFASHTYRDMPFVLCPMLWHQLAGRFQRQDEARERAHGDGLFVSVDSPEAFEEMIWQQFWPQHYRSASIVPWGQCEDGEFTEYLRNHMRKIVALRIKDSECRLRYTSKNNMNVARLPGLLGLFPSARILVPFRQPLQHAASLLKQHLGFLKTHGKDSFARRYMAGIGHYDFGENLKPINFDGWLKKDRRADSSGLQFWIEYWVATYRHVLSEQVEGTRIVSYDRLVNDPDQSLAEIARFLQIDDEKRILGFASRLRPPREHVIDTSNVATATLEEAEVVCAQLERKAAP